eukprot:TRINITY_DN1800_c0_g1_i1.p1 TRINITY_DN1800_c0_g1~~TRINITY_DN1800_c0_g1_i1.p1  ORF type:complete len:474 (+),score=164.89 TRINITY_DN1800_c0_g1_i1:137-1423(+)
MEQILETNSQFNTFDNLVDHFDSNNKATYKQRYLVNDTYYKEGGPIFMYLGGEGAAEEFLGEVQMFKWCKQFNAKYILIEHRYYGLSSPTLNYSTENMRFLTSEQALADAANFLVQYNTTLTNPGPWVIFGCSYSGCLSSWFRSKYPELVIGGYGPSGPVEAQADFTMYMGQFRASAGDACADAVQESIQAIEQMIPNQLNKLSEIFNSCKPLTQSDLYYFKYTLSDQLAGQAQEDLPPVFPLAQMCKIMTGSGDPVQKYAAAFAYGGVSGNCNDFSADDMVKEMSQTSVLLNYNGGRSWMYQSCNEFGFFQTSHDGSSVFFDDLYVDEQFKWCAEIFSLPEFSPNTDRTNKVYGGKNLTTTNLIITQGLIDPWHNLGIIESSPGITAVTYESGHCAPLHEVTDQDPSTLTAARAQVTSFLVDLLEDY